MNQWFSFFCLLLFLSSSVHCHSTQPIHLKVIERQIKVGGKTATVYGIVQPDGTFGLRQKKGEQFDVILENTLNVPTSVHWHGLILPSDQDGVAFITQFPIYPGLSYHYRFPLVQAGTFWMHSHFGLQEQRLLSAPLILEGPEDAEIAAQDVVVLFADFSFKTPMQLFEELRNQGKKMMAMSSNMHSKHPDLVDVNYDAFLANSRTLEEPEIFTVPHGKRIRLRLINGASSSNFFISTGNLKGEAIAVDGHRIEPLLASRFELAVAQRIDILVDIPPEGGVFPILAQGEGTDLQTGFMLATKGTLPPKLPTKAAEKAGALTNKQELLLKALSPLSVKPIDRSVQVVLGGDMANYVWTLNGQIWPEVTPIVINKGERIEISFKNVSSMAHPMHLHGHVFQVTAIDGKTINGALRDTVLVLPNSTVNIQFDADNPGVWPLHCHLLYHLEGGMLTVVRYKEFIQPLLSQKD